MIATHPSFESAVLNQKLPSGILLRAVTPSSCLPSRGRCPRPSRSQCLYARPSYSRLLPPCPCHGTRWAQGFLATPLLGRGLLFAFITIRAPPLVQGEAVGNLGLGRLQPLEGHSWTSGASGGRVPAGRSSGEILQVGGGGGVGQCARGGGGGGGGVETLETLACSSPWSAAPEKRAQDVRGTICFWG